MTATLKEVLRNTLCNLTDADFKTFKHYLRDQGQIAWGELEKADRNDTVDWMVQVHTMGAGGVMMTILQKMKHKQLAMDMERDLAKCGGQQCSTSLAAGGGGINMNMSGAPAPQQVGRYGDVMKIETTGASAATARQDGNNEIFGIPASFELAETDLERMDRYKNTIINVGRETGVDPAVIAGIISRASRAGSEYVMVDGWNGNRDTFGLMQIAKQWHTLKGDWDSEEHIKQGTGILTSSIRAIKKRFPKWTMEQQLKGGIAAYCAGPQNVPADYKKVDENTFAKDYSNDVVARAQFYRGQGFHL